MAWSSTTTATRSLPMARRARRPPLKAASRISRPSSGGGHPGRGQRAGHGLPAGGHHLRRQPAGAGHQGVLSQQGEDAFGAQPEEDGQEEHRSGGGRSPARDECVSRRTILLWVRACAHGDLLVELLDVLLILSVLPPWPRAACAPPGEGFSCSPEPDVDLADLHAGDLAPHEGNLQPGRSPPVQTGVAGPSGAGASRVGAGRRTRQVHAQLPCVVPQ